MMTFFSEQKRCTVNTCDGFTIIKQLAIKIQLKKKSVRIRSDMALPRT